MSSAGGTRATITPGCENAISRGSTSVTCRPPLAKRRAMPWPITPPPITRSFIPAIIMARSEGDLMRTATLFVVLLLSMSGLASAQDDWTDYVNIPDGFHVDFPGQPKITNITWDSWHQFKYPAHVYTFDKGNEHYSMTVVDYATAE